MYPKFTQILQTLAAADTKGLWQRWLRSTPEGCSSEHVDLLFQTERELYLSCLLAMFLAPSDDFVREHTAWVFTSKKIRDEFWRYCSDFDFAEIIRNTRRPSQLLSAFERIVCALLDDLEALSHLSETDGEVWMGCEQVIKGILLQRSVDDPDAVVLFDRFRFYCPVGEDESYWAFMEAMSPRPFSGARCKDLRWRRLALNKMQDLVRQESQGIVPQPASCGTFGAQYVRALLRDADHIWLNLYEGLNFPLISIDHDAEVLFAAQLGLFAQYCSGHAIVVLIDVTASSQTHQALLLNLLAHSGQPGVDWEIENLFLCEKLGMVIKGLKSSFTKDQYTQLNQIHRKLHDRAKHIQRELKEVERAEQPKDVAKAMKRLKR